MPDEDPFEIARRLDEFGAGKGPRPPKPADRAKAPATKIVKKRARPTALIIFSILVFGAVVYWVVFQRGFDVAPGFFKPSPTQASKPTTVPMQPDPPKMIPSFDGKGEVPAFTVQVPGTNTPPPPPSTPKSRN